MALHRRWIGQWLGELSLVLVYSLWNRKSLTGIDCFLNKWIILLILVSASFLHGLCGCMSHWNSRHEVCCPIESVVDVLNKLGSDPLKGIVYMAVLQIRG